MEVEILHARSGKSLCTLTKLSTTSTIDDVKNEYRKTHPACYPTRQGYKSEPRGKMLKGSLTLEDLGITKNGKLYFKDLGPQIGWTTVFLTEYAGPLVTYLLFYFRPSFIYGDTTGVPRAQVVQIACACWSFHYAKRLLETIFVHRFSNATMPIMNIFKNSAYYWGFAGYVAYYVNHPLYTPPTCNCLIYGGLALFAFCELGNLSIHVALRNLRPPGTKERRIPYPTSNPLTYMFKFVSCPNYTYETGAWLGFSIMTLTLPALFFCVVGFGQMAIWAQGKHRNYKKEFKNYPRGRTAILPFVL